MKSEQESGRGGFTLLELLAVMAIMLGLAGLLFGAMGAARVRTRRVNTMAMVKQIGGAWAAYRVDYGKFPDNMANGSSDSVTPMVGSTSTDNDPLDILRSYYDEDSRGGRHQDYAPADNPRQIAYMPLRLTTEALKDSWGNPYRVVVDGNYDNRVDVDSTTLRRQVAVWSLGPDGRSGTPDDIMSWKGQ